MNNKKDKHMQIPGAVGRNAAASPEVLKLPSNTYLRAVTSNVCSNANSSNIRNTSANYAMSLPAPLAVQRYNISVSINLIFCF